MRSIHSVLLFGLFAGLGACASQPLSEGATTGGTGGGATAGQSAGSTGGSTGTTTGGACGCSSACCSEQASASSTRSSGYLTCPGGSKCWGSWYCDLAAGGGCTQTDPCNGQGGSYTPCGGSAGSTSGGSAGSTSGGSGGSTSSGNGGGTTSGYAGSKGPIGPAGGKLAQLLFAVVGDARPPSSDDVSAYPSAVLRQIYQDIETASPQPPFAVMTGDYMYCGSTCQTQAQDFLGALGPYTGQVFPTMGNHECTGYTSSNCGPSGTDGISANYTAYLGTILPAFGITPALYPTLAGQEAYYSVNVSSSDSSNPWTAKFVFVAANAWDSGQSSWLSTTMQQQTTYTFVVRHEPDYDGSKCSGCGASDTIIDQFPYTLLLTGHDHTYRLLTTGSGQTELVVGNGGAPLSSTSSDQYGYTICAQQSNGNIACQEHDYNSTGSSYQGASVTVNPQGAAQ
ncbi:MAG: metallophosphoesterase [Deltaproteobacteria bacterium]